MKFLHVYKHKIYYFPFCFFIAFFGVLLYFSPENAPWLISSMIGLCALFAYQIYNYTNKLLVGVNEEGICIWQRRNYYLFCPWESIQHIAVRSFYAPKRGKVNYVDISYQKGTILYPLKATTYIKENKDVVLEIVEEEPSTETYSYLYEKQIPIDIDRFAQVLNRYKKQYRAEWYQQKHMAKNRK